ncbi:MAG: 50S ribosomal protein L37 [Nitrososphaerota archaeon]|nr:50S ribosomal protein L37 [Nitrososphaerales archaeon]MDW8044535.1 50S ribosomal protein L37 [Nitrososphaerota archaeon]
MGRGKVTSSLPGLGAKYGATLRKRYSKVIRLLKSKRRCPQCGSLRFKRIAIGIWGCPICNFKVAGGAYDISVESIQS